MKKLIMVGGLVFCLAPSAVGSIVEIGDLSFGGKGCPSSSGSVEVTLSRSRVKLELENYEVEVGRKKLDRSTCNITIPIDIKPGFKVAISKVKIKGVSIMAPGTQLKVSSEFFVAGQQGVKNVDLIEELDGDFKLTQKIPKKDLVWSKCGGGEILRANTSLLMKGNQAKEAGVAAITSITGYSLKIKPCNDE